MLSNLSVKRKKEQDQHLRLFRSMSMLLQKAVSVQRAGCHQTPTEEKRSLTFSGTLVLTSRMKTRRWSISLAFLQIPRLMNGMNLTGE
jgi:hypothetical protein